MNLEEILGEAFFELHRDIPREGPGDDVSTLRALGLCAELPGRPEILDVGCGPGMQTVALAGATDSSITAVDLHGPFLDQLRERAAAAGVGERITTIQADMAARPFEPGSFDLVWCEGAAFIVGIEAALVAWRPLVRPGGYLVFSDLMWLVPDPPHEPRAFFTALDPGITDVASNLERVAAAGYEVVGHFTLLDESWWTHYYDPLSERIPGARQKYANDGDSLVTIEQTADEISMRRAYPDSYGYEFIVARSIQAVEPEALPLGGSLP
jgi:SAM-dependent methyltransferase